MQFSHFFLHFSALFALRTFRSFTDSTEGTEGNAVSALFRNPLIIANLVCSLAIVFSKCTLNLSPKSIQSRRYLRCSTCLTGLLLSVIARVLAFRLVPGQVRIWMGWLSTLAAPEVDFMHFLLQKVQAVCSVLCRVLGLSPEQCVVSKRGVYCT